MTDLQKARLCFWLAVLTGGYGVGSALWSGPRWVLAGCSFVYGSTLTLLWLGRHHIWRKKDPEHPELNA